MDHSATIAPPPAVTPGAVATIGVTVRNGGSVVERYDVQVLGDAAAWAEPPPSVIVYPGQEQYLSVIIPVPDRALAGEVPVGILVAAQEAQTQLTEETTLSIGPTWGLDTALVPSISHGRRHGMHSFALINRGNVPITVACQGQGDDLEVDAGSAGTAVGPFTQTEVPVRVSHLRRRWLRAAGPSPFTVAATSDHGEVSVGQGTHEAASRVPRWTPLAVVVALALLLAAFALRGSRDAKAVANRAEDTAAAAETPISLQAQAINDLAKTQGLPEPLPAGSPGNPGQLGPPAGGASGSGGSGSSGS
ncbi:MAG: hypothetical protein ABIS47_12795, partial [Acidimicrobiales bacterium]